MTSKPACHTQPHSPCPSDSGQTAAPAQPSPPRSPLLTPGPGLLGSRADGAGGTASQRGPPHSGRRGHRQGRDSVPRYRVQARGRGASGTAQSPAPRNPQRRDVSPRHRWFETSPTSGGHTEAQVVGAHVSACGRSRRGRGTVAGADVGTSVELGAFSGKPRVRGQAGRRRSGSSAGLCVLGSEAGRERNAVQGSVPDARGAVSAVPRPPAPPPARQLLPAASAGRASGRCELSGPWQQLQLEATAGLCQLPAGARDHTLRDVCWGPKKALPGDKGGEDAGTWTRAQGGWRDAGSGPEAEAPPLRPAPVRGTSAHGHLHGRQPRVRTARPAMGGGCVGPWTRSSPPQCSPRQQEGP